MKTNLSKDRGQRYAFVNTVMALEITLSTRDFLIS